MNYSHSVIHPANRVRHAALLAFADLLDDMIDMVSENPEDSSALQNVIADARWTARNAAYQLTHAYADDCRNQATTATYKGE